MSMLRGSGALARAYLLETWRMKITIFWNLVFPLLTMIGFSYIFGGGEAVPVGRGVPGLLTINLLAGAFFGISLHMVSLRERELYRRFEATPLTALAVIAAHAITGAINVLIAAVLQLVVARLLFHIEIRGSLVELFAALLIGVFAFVPLGLLAGSVVRDMRIGPAISNLLFFPLSFLSGAAMPLYFMPHWAQEAAKLLPSTYLVELLQAVMLRGSLFHGTGVAVAVLLFTGVVAFAADAFLFRWESRQPIEWRKLAVTFASLAVIYGTVFFVRGVRLRSAERPEEARARHFEAGTQILAGMTIWDGIGGRIERGEIVMRGNRIVEVREMERTVPREVPVTDLSGLYVIPGLIDSHVHLGGSGGGSAGPEEYMPERLVHDTQVYLAHGVTSFVSLTDHLEDMQRLQRDVASGAMRAPRPFISGPGITAPGGHPAELFAFNPALAAYMTREVTTAAEAEKAVRELVAARVNIIKLYLEAGQPGRPLPVLSEAALQAGVRTAKELDVPVTVHVDNDRHAQMAIRAGAKSLEHIPFDLSDATIASMKAEGVTLTPTLVAAEALAKVMRGDAMEDAETRRWVEPPVLRSLTSPDSWIMKDRGQPEIVKYWIDHYEQERKALRRAVEGGVTILAGSDAGNPGVFPGMSLIRELELLVEAGGMTRDAALRSAEDAAARRLRTQDVGRIGAGAFADLVVLESDPTEDFRALRRVRTVYLGGVPLQIDRLLKTNAGSWRPLFSFPAREK